MLGYTGFLFRDYSHALDCCERPIFMTVYCENKIIYCCFAIFQMKTLSKTEGDIFIKALCYMCLNVCPTALL